MPGIVIVNYRAASEREAKRRHAADERREQSGLATKAATEARSPSPRATRQPRPRHLVRPA
jgi:hypothetical protein